jgi:hypothetical protein
MHVDKNRRRGLLMLAMMALWTMLPVSACLRASQSMGQHACCHGVAQVCDSSAINASGSCCLVHWQGVAVVPVLPDTVDPLQALAVMWHPANLSAPAITALEGGSSLVPPPAILSSAGNSILRI